MMARVSIQVKVTNKWVVTRFPSLGEKLGFILSPHFVTYLPPFRVVNREYIYLCLLFVLFCLQAYFICLLTPITSGVIRVPKSVPKTSIFPLVEHQDMGSPRIIHMTLNTPYGVYWSDVHQQDLVGASLYVVPHLPTCLLCIFLVLNSQSSERAEL